MSLSSELHQLQAAQHSEINRLHRTYLRTKREVKRELSPRRWIRKHPGTAIGIAAVAGFFFAPARSGSQRAEPPRQEKTGGMKAVLLGVTHMIKHMLNKQEIEPPAQSGTPAAESGEKSAFPALLETLVAGLIGSLNLEKLFASWARAAAEKLRRRILRHHEGNGRHDAQPETQSTSASEPGASRFHFEE